MTTGSALKKKAPSQLRSADLRKQNWNPSVLQSPKHSARKYSSTVGLSKDTISRILYKELHFNSYKIMVVHLLKLRDFVRHQKLIFITFYDESQKILLPYTVTKHIYILVVAWINKISVIGFIINNPCVWQKICFNDWAAVYKWD